MTTAADLIKEGYILGQVIDPQEEVEGYIGTQGLNVLNTILDQWSSVQIYIPTYTLIPINTVAGTYLYTVTPPLTDILEASYYDSANVKFDLEIIDLKRQNTLNYQLSLTAQTRPSKVFLQNDQSTLATNISKIFLFPVPDQVYNVTLYSKQIITHLTYSGTILNISPFCFKALQYQLAKEFSIREGTILPADFKDEYDETMRLLRASNKKDMTAKNSNPLLTYRRFRPYGGGYVG